jgi:hypothetical protein
MQVRIFLRVHDVHAVLAISIFTLAGVRGVNKAIVFLQLRIGGRWTFSLALKKKAKQSVVNLSKLNINLSFPKT